MRVVNTIRPATEADAEALHALISAHVQEGHLLPRELDEIRKHADRFVVAERGGDVKACAELAPLSKTVAEVRSLVVSKDLRRTGIAARLIDELRDRARGLGIETFCAFTHDARFFAKHGFSIVPHVWVPEKIATDCLSCALFRRCGQYAMVQPLHLTARYAPAAADAGRVAVA